MKIPIKKLCIASVLMALTVALTAFLAFPVPSLKGAYVHIGDAVIFLCAYFLGGWYAAAVGGIGGAIADFIVAPQYALATLLIKALMGLSAGLLMRKADTFAKRLCALLPSALIMVIGYFLWESLFFGLGSAAWIAGAPFNLLQAAVSIAAALPCISLLEKYLPRRMQKEEYGEKKEK